MAAESLKQDVLSRLEASGALTAIKAQLHTVVFNALKPPAAIGGSSAQIVREFARARPAFFALELVVDLLDHFKLENAKRVLLLEGGLERESWRPRHALAASLGLDESGGDAGNPLLLRVVQQILEDADGASASASGPDTTKPAPPRGSLSVPSQGAVRRASLGDSLPDAQLAAAQAKFDHYDRDKNGSIDKEELRSLLQDLFPDFPRAMLDRYVNDEFRATDRDFSNSIDFAEFVSLYKRLIVQGKSVGAQAVRVILDEPFTLSPRASTAAPTTPQSLQQMAPSTPSFASAAVGKLATPSVEVTSPPEGARSSSSLDEDDMVRIRSLNTRLGAVAAANTAGASSEPAKPATTSFVAQPKTASTATLPPAAAPGRATQPAAAASGESTPKAYTPPRSDDDEISEEIVSEILSDSIGARPDDGEYSDSQGVYTSDQSVLSGMTDQDYDESRRVGRMRIA